MTDHEGRAVLVVLNDCSDIGREVFELHALPWASAFADAARLRPKHVKARACQLIRDGAEIRRAAAKRRQHHDGRALALRQHFEPGIAVFHHDVLERGSESRHDQARSEQCDNGSQHAIRTAAAGLECKAGLSVGQRILHDPVRFAVPQRSWFDAL